MGRQPWPKTPAEFDRMIAELAADNDRGKAVLGGALLDFALTEGIEARLRSLEEGERKILFSDNGPFGTCSSKIQAGYALGLFGPQHRNDMRLINRIRNDFAHEMAIHSFSNSEIANKCREIKTATNSDAHNEGAWAQKFVLAIQLIAGQLIMDAGMHPQPPVLLTELGD